MRATDGTPYSPGDNEAPAWVRPLLAAGSFAFAAAAQVRGVAYDAGLLPAHRAAVPVISIGNLRVGGSGKTPFVLLLVEALRARGERPAVLSRGYGRAPGAGPCLVPPGGHGLRTEVTGDEPLLMATKGEVMVSVDPDRVQGAARAVEAGATVLVLDDGFQHRRLARNLDIVLLDAADLGAHMLPRGPLREGPAALSRADLVVWVSPPAEQALPCPAARVEVVADGVGQLGGARAPVTELRGAQVGLLTGIARPWRVRATLEGLGASVVHHLALEDHARILASTVEDFVLEARAAGAIRLLTTEKDAVRWPAQAPELEALAVRHRVVAGEAALDAALDQVFEPGPPGPPEARR